MDGQQELQEQKKKKKVQFRNVKTESDSAAAINTAEMHETSVADNDESQDVSREDTMVEHSVVVNEETNEED